MNTVISFLVLSAIVISVPVAFWPVAILWILLLPFGVAKNVMHKILGWWADYFMFVSPYWKYKSAGFAEFDKRRPYVIVTNHQSMLDIVVVYRLSMQFRWVSKIENFKIPLFGWLMKMAGYIELDRKSSKSILKMYTDCEKVLEQGESVLIFPEGTRSRTGELQKFKDGAFKIAREMKVPILPVVIDGTHGAMPSKGIRLSPKTFRMKVLPPVEYDQFSDKNVEETVNMVRNIIKDELQQMRNQQDE